MSKTKQATKKVIDKTEDKLLKSFPIVGIGASAGGLEALEQFFINMPPENGMAFVVIQHLDPHREDMMPELLQHNTTMKVVQARDALKVKPNCVYVIPPNKSMSILNGTLHLFEQIATRGLRLPIDIFFRSMADDQQERSIGIILSGMGSDGSLGLKSIKEKNGIVLVQDPAHAKFDGMPQSAIDSVEADIVASAEELPLKLIEFLQNVPLVNLNSALEADKLSNIDKIIILLREHSGHDFSLYKKTTLTRRIDRRQSIHQFSKISNYVRFLQENPKEVEILFKELLIGVTNFFRDAAVWEMLSDKILPDLLEKLPDGYMLRAWVPACSTGEEAYSLAIIFKEAKEALKIHKNISLQIFATDLDNDAIEKARKGSFSKNIVADVSSQRINRYFTEEEGVYRLNTDIREMIVFATQNVIKDPPFTKLDFLLCRNLLIYMESNLQKKLISMFNYCLNSEGILVLGISETLGIGSAGFTEIGGKLNIFRHSSNLPNNNLTNFPSSFHNSLARTPLPISSRQTEGNIQSLADQVILQYFAPAGVLVNAQGDIIYFTGRTGKYLEPAAGKANWNIHAMARPGLREKLTGAFQEARNSTGIVKIRNVKIGAIEETRIVDISLQRIAKPEQLKDMFIIIFTDVQGNTVKFKDGTKPVTGNKASREKELEDELNRTYADLFSCREEMQTSKEELRSINEELQSTNEELQSNNEELTTSKEEMQSLNEELQTVNMELQSKIRDFVRANNDMNNMLNSTEIATLFLDMKLNIRRFTENLTNIFKLRISDIGRPYTDLVSDLNYPEIDQHAQKVLKTLTTIESITSAKDGRWFSVRIMPYRTTDDRIDGLVITFTDITIAKKLELELKKANEILVKKGL